MKWIKSIAIGLLGSLVMFILMKLGISSGIAPFNIPPLAFLVAIGIKSKILALLIHFGYGAFWSVVLLAIYRNGTTIGKGIGLAMILWLVMMIIYSPIIGWGLFGLSGTPAMAASAPLYLAPGPKYLIITLILHLIYGGIIGWGNAKWAGTKERASDLRTQKAAS